MLNVKGEHGRGGFLHPLCFLQKYRRPYLTFWIVVSPDHVACLSFSGAKILLRLRYRDQALSLNQHATPLTVIRHDRGPDQACPPEAYVTPSRIAP